MKRTARPNRGFSLIELTVVIAIVGILMTISAGAFVRYYLNAKQRATEAMMQIVDDQLGQRVESFWKKVNPPIRTRHAVMAGLGIIGSATYTPTNEAQSVRLRRANLLAKLEAMRSDFPQQFADFLPAPNGLATSTDVAAPLADNAVAVTSRARAAIEAEYRRLTYEKNAAAVPNNAPRGVPGYNQVTQIAPHDPSTESAACLYLMLKVGSGEGRAFDMGLIPQKFIKDTDGDGVPEIVDGWGTPVRFYRWPTDLIQSLVTQSSQMGGALNVLDAGNSNNQNTLDPEKILYTTEWLATQWSKDFESNAVANRAGMGNFFWVSDHPSSGTAGNRNGFSYPIYPMIVSAGADALNLPPEDRWQAFGLLWSDAQTATPTPTGLINYSWPPVSHLRTRSGEVSQEFSTTYPGAGMHVDNIYSRAMQAGREASP
jgi:prepilin-type N-terminal cleavage/methylation domain-containing protein